MNNIELSRCSNCGGELIQGYLLGKHNRIRWSLSDKGMTIFHGVPLNRLKTGFWHRWNNWLYAPSIPAAKCETCKLVLLPYNNDEKENPIKEIISSIMAGLFLIVAGIIITAGTFYTGAFLTEISLLFSATAYGISLLMMLLGSLFVKHAFDIK